MNWTVVIIVSFVVVSLVVFIIVQNQKDKKDYEQKMNTYYPNPNDGDEDEEDEL